jgi:hypothetical protein
MAEARALQPDIPFTVSKRARFLRARSWNHRVPLVLVVCPSALQIQWRDQMQAKFGLEFRIIDSDLMRDLRRSRGIHANRLWRILSRSC